MTAVCGLCAEAGAAGDLVGWALLIRAGQVGELDQLLAGAELVEVLLRFVLPGVELEDFRLGHLLGGFLGMCWRMRGHLGVFLFIILFSLEMSSTPGLMSWIAGIKKKLKKSKSLSFET